MDFNRGHDNRLRNITGFNESILVCSCRRWYLYKAADVELIVVARLGFQRMTRNPATIADNNTMEMLLGIFGSRSDY
jgi:hypothetical protein